MSAKCLANKEYYKEKKTINQTSKFIKSSLLITGSVSMRQTSFHTGCRTTFCPRHWTSTRSKAFSIPYLTEAHSTLHQLHNLPKKTSQSTTKNIRKSWKQFHQSGSIVLHSLLQIRRYFKAVKYTNDHLTVPLSVLENLKIWLNRK